MTATTLVEATEPSPAFEARSARPRDLSPVVDEGDVSALAAGNRAFAFDLYHAIQDEPGNLFFSPYSLSVALAMTYAGAEGDTQAEMADVLHFGLPDDRLHPAFNATDLALTDPSATDEAFTLTVANSLWGQAGFDFAPAYLDVLAINYGAGLRLADFVDPAQREQARQAINAWVSQQTQDKIKELFPEDVLTEDTRLVLANAIYFQADWEVPFVAEVTRPAPFMLLDGERVEVPTMTRRAVTGYAAGPGYEAVELTYQGERASMVILLPAPGEFAGFEASVDSEQIEAIVAALQPTDLQIDLPKFQFASALDLGTTLSGLGMPSAFDAGRADFSGMTGQRDLVLTAVVHKAFVAVDEKGTEAAAATGIGAGATSVPQVVSVDRPFLFFIHDRPTGTVLFVGRVLHPLE